MWLVPDDPAIRLGVLLARLLVVFIVYLLAAGLLARILAFLFSLPAAE